MPAVRVLTPARGLIVAAAAFAALTALAGCGHVDTALSKQYAVVNFRPDTTLSTLLQIRQSCSHVPNAAPMTPPSTTGDLDAKYTVRYEVGRASGANLGALRTCLQKFRAVTGVAILDGAGS